ncbi:hypothetical protein BDEG_27202 [Batrachochytrium dendrobatidis JEL423]|nr:hypothetical protein BDEG_27202 [Batrachochytrium dendrobatidis JEL423]
MISGVVLPKSGHIYVKSKSGDKVMDITDPFALSMFRQELGVCPQFDVIFESLTVREHLELYCGIKGVTIDGRVGDFISNGQKDAANLKMQYVEAIARDVELYAKLDAYISTLSGGMRRKPSVAIALLGSPRIVLLDEPTTGMDVAAQQRIWSLIRSCKKNRVLILTTHSMEEADVLGDRIAIMSNGHLKTLGTSIFLKSQFGTGYSIDFVKSDKATMSNQLSTRADSTILKIVQQFFPAAQKMSGHNTPISTAHSFLSLNTPRVSVEATINSDLPGLKTLLVEYFFGARLFAKIQRTDTGITQATVQGHPKQFPSSLEYLRELLQIKYDAAIVWGEASAVSEESRYNSITIEEALPTLERDPSSGEFLEKELDEISFGGSAATEALKKIVKETFASMENATTGFGIAKGWIPAVPEKHITVKRGDEEYDLEVSTISSLSALIEAVQKKFPLALKVKKLYRLHEGTPIVVTDVKDLRQEYLYYVLAGFEELPKKQITKFTTMEEFFDKLKIQQELDDDEIQLIKDCLGKQKVKFTQLMATGDLALTDEKLKEIGISQLGLRTAVLLVIKGNQ